MKTCLALNKEGIEVVDAKSVLEVGVIKSPDKNKMY